VLLAAYDTRRPTRDVDLQGQHMSNEVDAVLDIVRSIAGIGLDDGSVFDANRATGESIREEDVRRGTGAAVR
jgi:hypothetical protein